MQSDAPSKHEAATPADQPGLIAPDTTGLNFFRADPALTDLLQIHLRETLCAAHRAASRPPRRAGRRSPGPVRVAGRPRRAGAAPARPFWPRRAMVVPSGLSGAGAPRPGEFGIDARALRKGILGWPETYPAAAKHAFTYLFEPGRVRSRLPDLSPTAAPCRRRASATRR